jgi:dolichyl-phosphate beta-glucosyltransferase
MEESVSVLGVDLFTAAAIVGSLLVVVAIFCLFYPAIVNAGEKDRRRITSAQVLDVKHAGAKMKESSTIVLSVVIPAYNEELRLPVMLQETYDYLVSKPCQALEVLTKVTGSKTAVVEWILVDDGSSDQTGLAFSRFVQQQKPMSQPTMLWKLITLPRNCGKGAAVQAGMLNSNGSYCLMVDADGATDFAVGLDALTKQVLACSDGSTAEKTVFIGSRAHIQQERSLVRRLLAFSFRRLLELTLGQAAASIQDTQCGFKLFSQTAAHSIFESLHLQRWAFDIEVLYLAVHLGMPVKEVVVPWHEVEGSKLHTSAWNLALVSLSMLRDMICVRLCYLMGIWKINKES